MIVHEKGLLNPIRTDISYERAVAYITEENGIQARISFAKMKKFPTKENECIVTDKAYSISQCEEEQYNQVCIESHFKNCIK